MSHLPARASKDDATATLAWNLRLKAELFRISSVLAERGIDFAVLKGIPLAERVYGSISARHHLMQDNDILVRRADLDRAIDAFETLGYELPAYRTRIPSYDVEFEMKLRRFERGLPMLAELHWHAFPPLLYPIGENLLWRHMEDFTLSGVSCKVPNPALTVLQLASHFVQHLGKAEWVLVDFATSYARWRSTELDSNLTSLSEALGLDHVLAFAFEAATAAGLLDTKPRELSSRRSELLASLEKSPWFSQALESDYARLLTLALLAKPRRLPRWLLCQLFPPIEVMALIYRTGVSPELYLRYFSRLFRPLKRGANVDESTK